MTRLGLLGLALLLAGCALPAPAPGTAGEQVVAERFDAAGAPWAWVGSRGCGLCSGAGGFGPDAEHEAFFVFENGRLLVVAFNARPGDEGLHAHEDVTYDADELAALLDVVPRGEGATWVVRTHTARLADAREVEALGALWTTPGPAQSAADYGVHYGRNRPDATPEHVTLHGPLHDGDPFARFEARLWRLADATRVDGAQAGAPALS